MKTILYIIPMLLLATGAKAQDTARLSAPPPTHIQQPANAVYQNNSQFYNKDNQIDPSKTYMTGNGQYIEPGYRHNVNRSNFNGFMRETVPYNNNTNVQISTVAPVILTKPTN